MKREEVKMPKEIFTDGTAQKLGAHGLAVLALCYAAADDKGRGHWPSSSLSPQGMDRLQTRTVLDELVDAELLESLEEFSADEVGGKLECGYYLPILKGQKRASAGFVWQLTKKPVRER